MPSGRTSGPERNDDAEYVFGGRSGVRVAAPGSMSRLAVGAYLKLPSSNSMVSWRFVDDDDVRPGPWLKLDEQAVIFTALHQANK